MSDELEEDVTPSEEELALALQEEPLGVDKEQLSLTDEERRKYLGRLAEFEVKLAALAEKQANFVLAVLQDPTNYTQAARVAGYSHPAITANQLLKRPQVAALIALGEQLREDRTFLTSDRTLHEYAIIAFSDINDYEVRGGSVVARAGVPAYATRAISSVELEETSWTEAGETHTRRKVKVRLWSKIDALKMLALYQKLLSGEQGEHLGTNVDKSSHVHFHQHQHNTWDWGDKKMTF